jgi:phenylacetate-CoA ligase
VVTREGERDAMALQVLPEAGASLHAGEIGELLAAQTKMRGTVEVVAELPNDGKVIDDQRDYSK